MSSFQSLLEKHRESFHPVVPFDQGKDKLYPFDFTDKNETLTAGDIADTERFATYINSTLKGTPLPVWDRRL